MEREYKDIKFGLAKVDDEAGSFDGYGSVFSVIDSYGDVVEPGAFKRTLRANGSFPLLWSHDPSKPIGIITAIEDDKGLKIHGELNLDLVAGQEIRSLIKQGAVRGISIGYEAVKHVFDDKEKVRRLKEIKLWELSLVVFPANPKSLVSNIKSIGEFGDSLNNILTASSINPDQCELARKAMEHIATLLQADPPESTHANQDPSLEPLFAAAQNLQRIIEQI